MINEDERKLINLIKLTPLFIIGFLFLITYIMIEHNTRNFEKEVIIIKEESINQKKKLIKNEVNKVLDLIQRERSLSYKKLKDNLKQRVYAAHSIASSIYEENKHKSKYDIQKMIINTLRDIRFGNGHGYFFIIEMSGVAVLHPSLEDFEKKYVLDVQNTKNQYPVKDIINMIKNKNEGFHTWWWEKPNKSQKEYEKIGFNKYFEPLDWFIGMGEYIDEHEAQVQAEILDKVYNIRFGENGYIFVGNEDGISLSHINKKLIGKNIMHLKDSSGFMIVENILKLAKSGGGYLQYGGMKMPSSGKVAPKISYIKAYKDWKWVLGTGTYMGEIEGLVQKKREKLELKNKKQIENLLLISVFVFLLMFAMSLLLAQNLRNRFKVYKNKVDEKAVELKNLNLHLENKVDKRTLALLKTNRKLKETLLHLKTTKNDLISAEKMASLGELVSSLTHEIQTPLGVSIISASHMNDLTKTMNKLYLGQELSESEFEEFLLDIEEMSKMLSINLNNTKDLLNSFKNIAVDQVLEETREFYIEQYIHEILLALKSKIKSTNIVVEVNCYAQIMINSYPGYLSQILTNLINNSLLHGFNEKEEGLISINVKELDSFIELIYTDNGKGIPNEITDNIFTQYFTTKRGSGGTGLGLYIIKQIIMDKLQGTITMDDSSNEGVRFVICIPKTAPIR